MLQNGASLVAFGDSITRGYAVPDGAGWVELLAGLLPAVQVVNAGGNGNTSAEGLARIATDVLPHLPALVLVEFGGNDAVHDARAVSVDEFGRNLLTIARQVRNTGGEIVLLTFPPIINDWHATHADPYYAPWGGLDPCVEAYRQRTRETAQRLGCPLFDLAVFLGERIAGGDTERFIQRDGVHLTPEANRLVAAAVVDFLTSG